MSFYIKKVQLWFKRNVSPVSYEFKPNRVNVITGDSSTGKSSILRIIDYCLLSGQPMIVENVINENVKYYGISFSLNEHDYVIVRSAPNIQTATEQLLFEERTGFPDTIATNMSRGEALEKMNSLFGYYPLTFKMGRKKEMTNFRHMLLFNYLTEDIIGTLNTYLDTRFFDDINYEKLTDELFKQAIGMDEIGEASLKDEIKKITTQISRNTTNKNKYDKEFSKYQTNVEKLIQEAKTLNIDFSIEKSSDIQEQCNKLKAELAIINKNAEKSRLLLDNELRRNQTELQNLKNRLAPYDSILRSYQRNANNLKKQDDSLKTLDYLEQHFSEMLLWDESRQLFDALSKAQSEIKQALEEIADTPKLPNEFEQERLSLNKQIIATEEKIKSLQEQMKQSFDLILFKKAWRLVWDLQNLKEPKNECLSPTQLTDINDKLYNKQQLLLEKENSNSRALTQLNDCILTYYTAQHGISNTYNSSSPKYNIERQSLELFNPDNETRPIKNIGSKSNYMFLHLCFFMGLHEQLLNIGSEVPDFLFIDQPSIPYYENMKKEGDGKNLMTDDAEKLKYAFSLINIFMDRINRKEKSFQIIMVEHAEPSYWENLNYFETRYEFRNGNALIPQSINNLK